MTVLLLTRFAAAIGGKAPSASWIASRWELFERYCLPSVKAQTFAGFVWWIYVHQGCDPAVAQRLCGYDHRINVMHTDYRSLPGLGSGPVVTVRLDSDDALSATALERIVAAAQNRKRATLIDLPSGYHVSHGKQRAYYGKGGAFKALVEPNQPRVGVYVESCDTIAKRFPTVTVKAPWLRVVHGGNLRNRYDSSKRSMPLAKLKGEAFPWLA